MKQHFKPILCHEFQRLHNTTNNEALEHRLFNLKFTNPITDHICNTSKQIEMKRKALYWTLEKSPDNAKFSFVNL